MPRLSSQARRAAARDNSLAALVARARGDSVEYPFCLANHLPMILVALDRLGADADRLEAYGESYRAAKGLVPISVPERGRIDAGNWLAHLGERDFEADYRAFFAGEVGRLGRRGVQAVYLPALAPGIAASALHALMRLAYANLAGDGNEAAVALAYWATTDLRLGEPGTAPPSVQQPLDVLAGLRARLAGQRPEPETGLLWHFMRAIAALPAFAPVPGSLIVTPRTLPDLRRAALVLMASTMSFEALHAVTGCHWLRLVEPDCPAMPAMLSAFWTAIAALYPKIGMPPLLPDVALDSMRRARGLPDWRDIAAAAIASDDEHDISLAFSAREEWQLTGDRLYQGLAARRLGLVDAL